MMDRNWWRQLSSEEEFYEISGLDRLSRFEFENVIGESLPERIRAFSSRCLQNYVPSCPEFEDDDLVNTWYHLHRRISEADENWSKAEFGEIFNAIMKEHAIQGTKTGNWSSQELEMRSSAFSITERKSTTGEFPSTAVLENLVHQYQQYVDAKSSWMGPYTTIIGPSGIGKSFAIKQLSVRHGVYVAYSNLVPQKRTCYPRPVAMGRVPSVNSGREKVTEQWKDYLGLQLRLIRACKKEEITPAGWFSLLTSSKPDLIAQREKLETALQSAAITDADLEVSIAECKNVLVGHSENLEPSRPGFNPREDVPSMICFDEARELLDDKGNLSFRSLRQAATEVFCTAGDTPFFIVLLDTTSRISNWTPLLEADPSRKQASRNVFPPIHRIDTWDVLVPDELSDVDGSVESVAKLFSHGRPLWASFLHNGDSVGDVANLARTKMADSGSALYLALLTYRINFYVTSRQLTETLVASLMRYLISISDNCSALLTSQPSEPVLAFAASRELQKPESRLRCINAWVSALQSGACNLGDVGEMVAALLLLFSVDYVSQPFSKLPHAVSTQSFFGVLLRSSSWTTLRNYYSYWPDVLEVLEDGWIFFNHFVRASSTPTADSLELAYKRGAALFLPANFPGMDIAIPIRIRKSGALAVLLVQVKNRHGDSPTPGLRMKMVEDLDKASRKLDTSRIDSVVGLAMCLRCSDNSEPQINLLKPTSRPLRPRKASASSSSAPPPSPLENVAGKKVHLLGIAFGLRGVYPCLRKTASRSGKKEEKSAAAKEKEHDSMDQICSLFEDLLGKWPDFYKEEDVGSAYAQKLLDPFYDKHAKEGSPSDDSSSDDIYNDDQDDDDRDDDGAGGQRKGKKRVRLA